MLSNCATFNKGNRVYIKYGNTYRKDSTPILEIAEKEEVERLALKTDEKFMTQLLNGVMVEYNGWAQSRNEVAKEIPPPTPSRGRGTGRRRQNPFLDVQELDTDDSKDSSALSEIPGSSKKSSRKRGIQDTKMEEDEEIKPSTSGTNAVASVPLLSSSRESKNKSKSSDADVSSPKSSWLGSPSTSQNLRRRVQGFSGNESSPKVHKKLSTDNPSNSNLRQTTLTNFFGTNPKTQQQVTFADMTATPSGSGNKNGMSFLWISLSSHPIAFPKSSIICNLIICSFTKISI